MAIRRVIAVLAVALALASWAAACSSATKYRALTFFFDGVPDPNAVPQVGYASSGGVMPGITPAGERVAAIQYAHKPYRENLCGGCHDPQTGQTYMPPNEGLCGRCHAGFTRDMKFVHGPAAVEHCAFCHHHHASAYEGVLHVGPTETCLRCHAREDLNGGDYHATIDEEVCTKCHNPHGGDDRFFLKRTAVE